MSLIGWIPSVSAVLAQKYETTVASWDMNAAKQIVDNARERVRSMQYAGDVNPGSVATMYTQKWHMPSVNEKVWKLLDIKV